MRKMQLFKRKMHKLPLIVKMGIRIEKKVCMLITRNRIYS